MTFLELCNRVRQESGVSGGDLLTVVNQQAILAKIVEWVRQADIDIKGLRSDWNYLWRTANTSLVVDQRLYSMPDLALFDANELLSVSINSNELRPMDWQEFKTEKYHTAPDKRQSSVYTFRPDGLLMVFPVPDAAYIVDVEYSKTVTPMQLDADVSEIPAHLHDAILQKALMYYASHEEDNSLYGVANARFEEYMTKMASECLPVVKFNRSRLF